MSLIWVYITVFSPILLGGKVQKQSTVNIIMGIVWDLLLRQTTLFYKKSVFVTFNYWALLSQISKLAKECNMLWIIFKSCHSDQLNVTKKILCPQLA